MKMSFTLWGYGKIVRFLPRQEHRYVEAWLYLNKPGQKYLHNSTHTKNYPFTEADEDWLENIRTVAVGCPSVFFTRKTLVDEN